MKKSLCALTLLISSMASLSQPSEAAIAMFIIPPLTGMSTMGIVAGSAAGTVSASVGLTIFATQVRNSSGERRRFYAALGALFLVLDDSNSVAGQTEAALAERYPFIEDRTVIRDLADLIEHRAAEAPVDAQGARRIELMRSEIESVFAPTDLFETRANQVERLIRDFE